MTKWFLIYTKLRQEKKACQQLQNQGYEVYLPMIQVEKVREGLRVMTEEPLFQRYLFIHLDEAGSQSWAPIRSTVGVASLVRFGQSLPYVSQSWMDALVLQAEKYKAQPLMESGDLVSITEGPFKGLEAIFQTYDGQARAILLLTLLSRATEASFGLTDFKKIP